MAHMHLTTALTCMTASNMPLIMAQTHMTASNMSLIMAQTSIIVYTFFSARMLFQHPFVEATFQSILLYL